MSDFDQAIQALAATQYGAFDAGQARLRGATAVMVQHRTRRGDWNILGDGVYGLAGASPSWRQSLQVALLIAGESAGISFLAAGALWRMPGFPERRAEILVPHGVRNHRIPNVTVHETRYLPLSHLTVVDGLRTTTVERTLCDLSGDRRMHSGRVERAVDNAISRRWTTPERLWTTWAELARPGRPGIRTMRSILLARSPGYVAPESELEALFQRLVAGAGLPPPEMQVDVGGECWIGRVDNLFRPWWVIVELDGRIGHASELDRKRDRERDNALMALGYRVLRFTWQDLVSRPEWVVRTLRAALDLAA